MKSIPKLGNQKHQDILQTIVDFYETDKRILAIIIFGSLGRGNWDEYSDLDLDIIMQEDISIDAHNELADLCEYFKKVSATHSIIVADEEEGDVVLSDLGEFSIRYHTLATTKPAILDTMIIVTGNISKADIIKAGNANSLARESDHEILINQCIRYSLELKNAIGRNRIWMANEMLYRIRSLLMQLYADSYSQIRHIHFFDSHAPQQLQSYLAKMMPSSTFEGVTDTLDTVIYVLSKELHLFSNNSYHLTEAQKIILQEIAKNR